MKTSLHYINPEKGRYGSPYLDYSLPFIYIQRQFGHESYLEHCKARIKDFKGIKNLKQPLVEVDVVPGITNRLDPLPKAQAIEKSASQCKPGSFSWHLI